MRLKEESIKSRKERIIQVSFQLFCEEGIESVKLSEIARKSEVGETTVYRYFGNKENLVLEAFLVLWDTMMSNVDKIVEGTPNYDQLTGYEQIRIWLEGFRYLYEKDGDFVLFSYEAKLYLLRHNIKLDKFSQQMLMHAIQSPCIAALEKGKKDRTIPTEESSEDLFYVIWGTVRGYVTKIVIYDSLYETGNPWKSRYHILEKGILNALSAGWGPPKEKTQDE